VFNWLADGRIALSDLPNDGEFVATHVQIDELNRTNDAERRVKLFLHFASVRPNMLPTESLILGVSRLGHAKLSDDATYAQIKGTLDGLNRSKPNNVMDALSAEVALKNEFTLITADGDLRTAAEEHGCKVLFLKSLNPQKI
jgi:hypothetical protein